MTGDLKKVEDSFELEYTVVRTPRDPQEFPMMVHPRQLQVRAHCPDCSSLLWPQSRCFSCPSCGWSVCG